MKKASLDQWNGDYKLLQETILLKWNKRISWGQFAENSNFTLGLDLLNWQPIILSEDVN